MIQRRLFLATMLVVALFAGLSGKVFAASNISPKTEKGLLITPVRQTLSANAGKTTKSSFEVANLTSSALHISFSVKQFSVTDYVYNYTFSAPTGNWLHPDVASVDLQPNQTATIPFNLVIPPNTAPGGYYYTLLASSAFSLGGVHSTIQAADLLYVTVGGTLTTVSHLEGSSISHLVFGKMIPFTLLPIDTGNVYSFVYVSGQLHGLFVHAPETSAAHILMPGKVRSLTGNVSSPILPGIYRATYGYKTTSGWVIQQSSWVLFIPPWSIAVLLAMLLLGGKFLPKRHKHEQISETTD